jgi:hypothetical protein
MFQYSFYMKINSLSKLILKSRNPQTPRPQITLLKKMKIFNFFLENLTLSEFNLWLNLKKSTGHLSDTDLLFFTKIKMKIFYAIAKILNLLKNIKISISFNKDLNIEPISKTKSLTLSGEPNTTLSSKKVII